MEGLAPPQSELLTMFRRIHALNWPRREHDVVNTDARGCVIETNSIIARLGKMRFSTRSRLLASVNQPSAAEVTHHA